MIVAPRRAASLILAASLLLGLVACPSKPVETPLAPDAGPGLATAPPKRKKKLRTPPPPPAADPAVADLPALQGADDPARQPQTPDPRPAQVAVRMILVAFQGAKGASGVTRDAAAAERRATRLARLARKQGADFLVLARQHSEAPPEERGVVEVVAPETRGKAFEEAAFGLGVGQVADPVRTKRGYVVIMRAPPEELASAHILILYKGALQAPPATTRTKEEAQKLAAKIRALAAKPDANFAVLCARNSDSPSRIRGGVLRPMAPGTMPAEYNNYIDALRQLAVGDLSPVVETPFGFHIIKRLQLVKIKASHILISYTDAENAPRTVRNKREAEALARKLAKQAQATGASFEALARKHSDHGATADKGGDLGTFAQGMMPARFEQIAFALKVGQVSDAVETSLGFHIIKRTE